MEKLPQKVADAYNEIRKRYQFFVALKRIHDNFYLYRQSTKWDRERKRVQTVSSYLGKITDEGTFVEKSLVQQGEPITTNAAVRLPAADANINQVPASRPSVLDETDLKLLTILSMNARADLSSWAKKLGLSASALYARRRSLEQRYGIRYTLEADMGKLGFLEYIAYVKFINEKPGMELLREALSKEPQVQFAAITSGDYDIFAYFLASDNRDVSNIVERLTATTALKSYASRWSVTPYFDVYGFIPFSESFFSVLDRKIWRKSKENPRPKPGELLASEFAVLKELNSNGSMEFTEIDARHKLPRGSAQYTFHRLKERGVIKRITASIGAICLGLSFIYSLRRALGG